MVFFRIIVGFGALLLVALAWARRKLSIPRRIRSLIGSLLAVNGVILVLALGMVGANWLLTPTPAAAAPTLQEEEALSGTVAMAAALSTGLAAVASGIAVAIVGSAAVGAVSEDPDNLGRTLIFVGLAEGIAIYGLITSFLILTR